MAPAQLTDRQRWIALAVLCVPLLIVSLDMTVLNVALPTLVRKLGATDSQLQWIVDAYVLVLGGLMLVSGSLSDRVGRKWTFMSGLGIFAACSTWAALSGSAHMLIVARAFMGVGATLIMPATLSIITNTFADPLERQRALGVWSATTGASIALGPIIGGLLLAHFAWGSVFMINVPIALLGLIAAIWLVPNSRNEHPEPIDFAGSAMSIVGIGLVLWAIISAPSDGWTSAQVLVVGGAGLVLLASFAIWESRTAHPLLRLDFFGRREFSGSVGSIGLMMFAMVGVLFVLTQFLQFQLGNTPLVAGVHMLPAAGGIALVAPFSSILVRRLGPKLCVAAGMMIVTGGLVQISGASITSHYSSVLPGTIALGLGVGVVMPAAVGTLMGTLPSEHTGLGSATNGTVIQIGGALGVAIIGSVMSARYQHNLTAVLVGHAMPTAVHNTIMGSVGGALSVSAHLGGVVGGELAHAARLAFMSGVDLSLQIAAGLAGLGILLALIVLPLRGALQVPPSKRRP
ncbi:MAG: MFS transporter [Solirubrobacteraceae bacterium]